MSYGRPILKIGRQVTSVLGNIDTNFGLLKNLFLFELKAYRKKTDRHAG